ncbi:MAG: type II secretion system protein, partial [Lentisphaeraceae bacterium]|nr:type II secretion system protein [Lentisphaeraceae bacterium]
MKCSNPTKFTLIELLVVIAIIGILASLIMPSLSKARRSAQKAVCLNNLKSLGTGVAVFMVDGHDANHPTPAKRTKPGHFPHAG